MSGATSLSDDELRALYQGAPAQTAPVAAPGASPLAGMTDDQLRALYGTPDNPPVPGRIANVTTGNTGSDALRFLETAGANAAAAATSLPRTVAQGVDWLGDKVGLNVGADKALGSVPAPGNRRYSLFPDFQTSRDIYLGGLGVNEYVPQTWAGRRGMDMATGAIGGLAGGPSAVIPAAAGAATGGTAAELFPDHPLLAAMLGFIPGAWAGKTIASAPQRIAGAAMNAAPSEPYGAFTRQGLPTELSGTVTGDPGLTYAEKLAARMPGSESAIGAAKDRLINSWQDRFNSVASQLGNASTPQEAGVSLVKDARDWLSNFKNSTGQLWNDFYSKVPQDTHIGTQNYEAALKNVLGNFSGAPATGAVLQSGTVKALSDALGVDLQSGQTLPWEAVKNIRTAIGERLENPQPISDTSQAALKQIYAGLTRDMEAGAGNVSQDALSSFHRANAMTAAGHSLLEDHLTGILTATNPEDATRYAMENARLGGSRLGAITFNLPGASGDLASYALRNAANNTQSPSALANALTGRRPIYSQEAQRVLFPTPGTQADIADLATTGRAMIPAERDLANSPTATHEARGPARIITAVELARQGHELAGKPGAAAGAALGLFAPNIAGRAAQATALNPWLSALYGRDIPFEPTSPSPLARMLIAPAVGQPRLPPPGLPGAVAPAITANSPPQ